MGHHSFVLGKKYSHRYSHGGELRKKRKGRFYRPLSTKHSLHVVLKLDRNKVTKGFGSIVGFKICRLTIKRYAKKFLVKVEQLAICGDHIHLHIRLTRRSLGIYFLRVVPGQIAQLFKNQGLWVTDTQSHSPVQKHESIWKHRPFTRVVLGVKAYEILRSYIKLNQLESRGVISYRKQRLKALKPEEWGRLIRELW